MIPSSTFEYPHTVRTILTRISRHRGDLHRWTEFPGLEAAVDQVNGIDWSDLQGKGIPGGPVKFEIPTFDDISSLSDSLEEGEIREDEIKIKKKAEDDPAVPLDIGPPQRFSQPGELLAHQNGCSCKPDSAEFPPEYDIQQVPQSPIPHHGHHSTSWDGLPHRYYQLLSQPFYPVMPYYKPVYVSYGFETSGSRGTDSQSPHCAGHSQFHAIPQRLAGTTHPGIPTPSFTSSPHVAPSGLQSSSLSLPQKPPPAAKQPSLSPLRATVSKAHDSQQHHKRKFLASTETSTSEPDRPRKRRLPVASDFMSDDDDEPEHNARKHTLPTSRVPDFGTWFQDQVTGSKKKLSHLKQLSAATSNRKGR